MATWNLSADAYPIFASRNYINEDAVSYGTFTASEMQALVDRVIDGDPYSYWQGSNQTDGTSVTLTFSLNTGAVVIERTVDLIILQNINWKNFLIEYSADGSTWTTLSGGDYQSGTQNNSATDKIINVTAGQAMKFIRFTITHTISAGQKKKCGGIIVCAGALQLSSGFLNYEVANRESVRELELGDKTISREYIMRSAADYQFYGASFDCPVVTAAELLTLKQIKRDGYPFVFIPEPNDYPGNAYLCHFDGAWRHRYESPVRTQGFFIPMKVKEVGSH